MVTETLRLHAQIFFLRSPFVFRRRKQVIDVYYIDDETFFLVNCPFKCAASTNFGV